MKNLHDCQTTHTHTHIYIYIERTGQKANPVMTCRQEVLQIKAHHLSKHTSAGAPHLIETVPIESSFVHVASNGPLMRCHISRKQ